MSRVHTSARSSPFGDRQNPASWNPEAPFALTFLMSWEKSTVRFPVPGFGVAQGVKARRRA
jgi:hypothetical protein